MWSLVSLPIGQHILSPDWSSHGASYVDIKYLSHQTSKSKSDKSMWSLVSGPIGQHVLAPDWLNKGASWLVELWHQICKPTDLKIKIWKRYVITGEPPHWSTHTGPWLVEPGWLLIALILTSNILALRPRIQNLIKVCNHWWSSPFLPFPFPACQEILIIASKVFADLKVLRNFCKNCTCLFKTLGGNLYNVHGKLLFNRHTASFLVAWAVNFNVYFFSVGLHLCTFCRVCEDRWGEDWRAISYLYFFTELKS